MIPSPLRALLLEFTKEVEANPQMYGPATTEFVQQANEAIGNRASKPLVGWVVPRGTMFAAAHPRIAGIELTDELRMGIILTDTELKSCVGTGCTAATAVANVRYMAKQKMDRLI